MKDKTKQIWYLYKNDLKQLKNDCTLLPINIKKNPKRIVILKRKKTKSLYQ